MLSGLPFLFFTSFLIAFSGALMPGPLLSLTISESSRPGGWKAGFLLILGHGILEILLLAVLFGGLSPLVKHPVTFVAVALAGSVFMLIMAVGMFRNLPGLSLEKGEETSERKRHWLPLSGALMSLANPYWLIWWATIGFGYVLSAGERGLSGVIVFFAGHILADLGWYAAVSLAINKSRRLLPLTAYRVMVGICAGFLVIYSGYLMVQGGRSLITLF
jgi:threonine/homoserine/homoserine lactone efflux protein